MLESLVDRICGLYSLPAVAMEVVRLSRSPKSDARGLAECLSRDPALTARLLQFVNSPALGLTRRIGGIDEAVAVLGVRPLQSVVLGFSLPPNLIKGIEKRILTRYWQHSLTKALAARELARMTHAPDSEEAFVSGLLQHLGMLALIHELGDPYVEFVKQVWNDRGNLMQLEIASLGFDHRALSSRMLERWQFPDHLSRVLAHPMHVDQLARMDTNLRASAQRLHLADHIARLLHEHDPIDWELLVDSAKLHFSMEGSEIEDLLKRLDGQLRELAPLFSLEWSNETSFEALLLESRDLLTKLSLAWTPPEGLLSRSASEGNESEASNSEARTPETAARRVSEVSQSTQGNSAAVLAASQGLASKRPAPASSANTSSPSQPESTSTPREAATQASEPSAPIGLATHSRKAIARCRQQRWPLTLILVSTDRSEELQKRHSHQAFEKGIEQARQLCRQSLDPGDTMVLVSDGKWGVLLEDCDRSTATTVARELHASLRYWSEQRELKGQFPITFSLGVACVSMIAKNFEASDLIERAETCLSSSQLSGGDTIKTISV